MKSASSSLATIPPDELAPAFATRRERRDYERRIHAARSLLGIGGSPVLTAIHRGRARAALRAGTPATMPTTLPTTLAAPATHAAPAPHAGPGRDGRPPRPGSRAVPAATVGIAVILAVGLLALATLGQDRLAPSSRPGPAATSAAIRPGTPAPRTTQDTPNPVRPAGTQSPDGRVPQTLPEPPSAGADPSFAGVR